MRVFVVALLLLITGPTWAQSFDHGIWNTLLQQHVVVIQNGTATQVDYDGFLSDRDHLTRYLDTLAAVSQQRFDRWSESERLAFLINAYNAWTVELILTEYPGLESIKDLGSLFRSPWKKSFIPLLGQTRSLDDIEHGLIRGAEGDNRGYNEPRIHFAVNCASIGCPALRPEAYTGAQLEMQLQQAATNFLSDRSRNRVDFNREKGGAALVSSIFKWYREDFETGWRGAHSLGEFLALYADALGLDDKKTEALRNGQIKIKFLDYDWSLNKVLN